MHRNMTFSEKMSQLMGKYGFCAADVYKAGNVDKSLFSRLLSNPDYMPSKDTAVSIALAMKLSLEDVTGEAAGFRLPLASPVFRLAAGVLEEMDPRGPVFQWDGASIPVLSVLREASGAAPLVVGWGQAQDRIHSPNESYSVEQFDRAREWGRRILEALG
jgi:hypothetical protein